MLGASPVSVGPVAFAPSRSPPWTLVAPSSTARVAGRPTSGSSVRSQGVVPPCGPAVWSRRVPFCLVALRFLFHDLGRLLSGSVRVPAGMSLGSRPLTLLGHRLSRCCGRSSPLARAAAYNASGRAARSEATARNHAAAVMTDGMSEPVGCASMKGSRSRPYFRLL